MKIVVALDSFKDTLDSKSACEIVKDAFLSVNASLDVIIKPIADGGEGTAQALIAASGGQWIPCRATGPLPHMTVDAGYAWFENTRTALVEMASASGLTLVDPAQRNPLLATTFGTGQLISACLNNKPTRILLAVGGSATVDGGIGMAAALGWRFLNSDGIQVAFGGRNLPDITKIIPPSPPLKLPRTEVLCDVTNPLTGPSGVACVFGPQKGASPEMVQILDNGLAHLAALVRSQLKMEIETVPGSGAAGGLAAGAIASLAQSLSPASKPLSPQARLKPSLIPPTGSSPAKARSIPSP
jgi:glycerate kinase